MQDASIQVVVFLVEDVLFVVVLVLCLLPVNVGVLVVGALCCVTARFELII